MSAKALGLIVLIIVVVAALAVGISKLLGSLGLSAGSGTGLIINVVGLLIFLFGIVAGVMYFKRRG
ncbi:MAG TPA: hypothetical protein ENG69_02475 [Candidatus Korarchaeota archaeon]|nr:hypothetical protein [Candidatus Korarchaeota archaeon]